MWVNELDKFSELYTGGTTANGESQRRQYNKEELDRMPYYTPNGSLLVSASLLFIMALVTYWFWKDYSLTLQTMWEIVPTASVQSSWKVKWFTPTY